MSTDSTELGLEIMTGAVERVNAAKELRSLGVEPSPADVEAWISTTARQRKQASLTYAIYEMAGYLGQRL